MSDPRQSLHLIERRVGKPPRRGWLITRRILKAQRMQVSSKDPISLIYKNLPQIVRNGELRWGVVIQANSSLFGPGTHTSGAQIVYSPSGIAPLHTLLDTANKIFGQKGTRPEHEEERKLAHMITDEYIRALDWNIPKTLSDGFDMVTTIVSIPRAHVPGGILAQRWFPVLADPETSMAALVPYRYWERQLQKDWLAQSELIRDQCDQAPEQSPASHQSVVEELKRRNFQTPPIVFTVAAAKQFAVRIRAASCAPSQTAVRVGVVLTSQGMGEYQLAFEPRSDTGPNDLAFVSHGIHGVVDYDSLVHLLGTTIDWLEEGGQAGFKFISAEEKQPLYEDDGGS